MPQSTRDCNVQVGNRFKLCTTEDELGDDGPCTKEKKSTLRKTQEANSDKKEDQQTE